MPDLPGVYYAIIVVFGSIGLVAFGIAVYDAQLKLEHHDYEKHKED